MRCKASDLNTKIPKIDTVPETKCRGYDSRIRSSGSGVSITSGVISPQFVNESFAIHGKTTAEVIGSLQYPYFFFMHGRRYGLAVYDYHISVMIVKRHIRSITTFLLCLVKIGGITPDMKKE